MRSNHTRTSEYLGSVTEVVEYAVDSSAIARELRISVGDSEISFSQSATPEIYKMTTLSDLDGITLADWEGKTISDVIRIKIL